MLEAPVPANEKRRLKAVHDLQILDTSADEAFDRVTRLAAHLFDVPIALVSILDSERQWFKSMVGVSVRETSRRVSFCGHAIEHDGVFLVPDARVDPRFADNPLVCGTPNIAFYAGVTLKSPDGLPLGTLCVIDRIPREPSQQDIARLEDLAAIVQQNLNLHAAAVTDPLTSLLNRRGLNQHLDRELRRSRRTKQPLSLILGDLDHFKSINDSFGHDVGDQALVQVSELLRTHARRPGDCVARLGGDEFLLLLADCDEKSVDQVCLDIRQGLASQPLQAGEFQLHLSMSLGAESFGQVAQQGSQASMMDVLDKKLYRAKRGRTVDEAQAHDLA